MVKFEGDEDELVDNKIGNLVRETCATVPQEFVWIQPQFKPIAGISSQIQGKFNHGSR